MRQLTFCLLLSLGACRDADTVQPAPTDSSDNEGGTGLDTGTPDSSTPWYSPEDLAELLQGLAETGLPHARALRDTYQELMNNGDEDCPGSTTEIENALKGCTADTGWYYGGLLTYVVESSTSKEGAVEENFWTDTCDFQIVDPDGVALIGGGDIEARWTQNPDGSLTSASFVQGSWNYPVSEHSWLATGVSTDLAFRINRYSGGLSMVNLWGTLGSPSIDLYMDNLYFDSEESCADQVSSGTVWIRQADGTWYELIWTEDCSGCFSVTWDSTEALGEACVDLSALKTRTVSDLEVQP